ncbi:MAG: hypothetical protein JNJ90_21365 [Saprospiraceae bacterium]|jgi:hypothetical protein|nr:hypothetical protein [Saprospiraceae bacterium]
MKTCHYLLLLLTALASCTEDNVPKPEESPFFTFFDEPNIAIDTTPVAATLWEYGFEFNPIASGKITKLGVKLPTTGNFVVRLWRLYGNGAPTVIVERVVTVNTAHEPTFTDINPLYFDANDPLAVTVWANSFYRVSKQDGSDFTFPLEVGNIAITSFKEAPNTSNMAMLPATKNSTTVAPCVNVVFVAD